MDMSQLKTFPGANANGGLFQVSCMDVALM